MFRKLNPSSNQPVSSCTLWFSVYMHWLTGGCSWVIVPVCTRADWSVQWVHFSVRRILQTSLSLSDKMVIRAGASDTRLWCGLQETEIISAARVWGAITRCVWIRGLVRTEGDSVVCGSFYQGTRGHTVHPCCCLFPLKHCFLAMLSFAY